MKWEGVKNKKKKKKGEEKAVAYISKQTELNPGSDGMKTGLHRQSSVAEARVL